MLKVIQRPEWWEAPPGDSPSRDPCLWVPITGEGDSACGKEAGEGNGSALPRHSCCPGIPCPGCSRGAGEATRLSCTTLLSPKAPVLQEAFFLCISKAPRFASQAEGGQGMPLPFFPKPLIPTIARSSPVLLLSSPCHLPLNISICLFPNGMCFFSEPIFLLFSAFCRFSLWLGPASQDRASSL